MTPSDRGGVADGASPKSDHAPLLCPVRGCGAPLGESDRALTCPRGHSFDRGRSGYVNLLQPQDRRSKNPGDTKEAALARRRLAEAGLEAPMLAEVLADFDAAAGKSRPSPAVLDVGCGEGFLLGSLAAARPMRAHGVDISVPAIDLAAKRWPGPAWIVANADRKLPWPDRSFDFVLSITARRNGPEIRRVLAASGRALLALPAEDDLVELREAVLGRGELRDRAAKAVDELRPDLELLARRRVSRKMVLDARGVRDVLAATYRGGRRSERERVERIGRLEVTMSRELLLFGPRGGGPRGGARADR